MRLRLLLLLLCSLAACAHRKKGTHAAGESLKPEDIAKRPTASDGANGPVKGEVSYTEEDEGDPTEEGDESDVADTDPVEGTPTDLGEVEQSSDKVSESEAKADALARQTFPMVENEFVEQWIRYFTGRGRKHFEKWIARTPRYAPLIRKTMKEDGLPEDLVYLAMIESGFNPRAKSFAKAVGPWQFIKSTGQRYGLQVDGWIDERRDIVKSTHAASAYLKELHTIFGSWYLAAASYNAGEGKVLNAVRRDRSRNFWGLARKKANFRPETRNYVPKIIAAALISKDPVKYGFGDVVYEEPLEWDVVRVPAGVHLQGVAEVVGIDKDALKLLNAELKRGVTPPGGIYELKVPKARGVDVTAKLEAVRAKKYKIVEEETTRRRRGRGGRVVSFKPKGPLGKGEYMVQPGDTFWDLAKKNGTSVSEIKRLNPEFGSGRSVRAGAVIKVPTRVD